MITQSEPGANGFDVLRANTVIDGALGQLQLFARVAALGLVTLVFRALYVKAALLVGIFEGELCYIDVVTAAQLHGHANEFLPTVTAAAQSHGAEERPVLAISAAVRAAHAPRLVLHLEYLRRELQILEVVVI